MSIIAKQKTGEMPKSIAKEHILDLDRLKATSDVCNMH